MTLSHAAQNRPVSPKKSVTLLGATGTIGVNTLKIIASQPDLFELVAITAGNNVTLLAQQARQFRPSGR